MSDQQPGTNPAEPLSYDADLNADIRSAMVSVEEASKAEPTVEKTEPVKVEPVVAEKTVAEPRADHPTDEKRYADGTFKPTKEEQAAAVKTEPAPKVEPEKIAQQPTQAAPAQTSANPPGGWSPKSKAEWEKLPEHIRSDIAKREKEVAEGFAQYEGMRELRPYVDMARQSGRSLKQALDSYVATERELYGAQPLPAILRLANVAGYSPQRLVAELAPRFGAQNQPQGNYQDQGAQPSVDPNMFQQWLNPLAQKIQSIESLFQQQSEANRAREMTTIGSVLERFKSDPQHRYYDNVEPRMTQLFESSVVPRTGDYATDLKAAYDMACRLDPEISELILNDRIAKTEAAKQQAEKEATEKARQASRSITGSPSAGPVRDDDKAGDSIEDDVRRAYRAHAA